MSELGPCTLFAGNHAELARLLLVVHEILVDGSSKSPFRRSFIATALDRSRRHCLPLLLLLCCCCLAQHPTRVRAVALVLQGGLWWFSLEVSLLFCTRSESAQHQPFLPSQFNIVCSRCVLGEKSRYFFTAGHQVLIKKTTWSERKPFCPKI